MSEPTTIQIERGTLVLITMVNCQNIPVISNKVYA